MRDDSGFLLIGDGDKLAIDAHGEFTGLVHDLATVAALLAAYRLAYGIGDAGAPLVRSPA